VLLDRRLGRFQSRCERSGKENKKKSPSLPPAGIELRASSP